MPVRETTAKHFQKECTEKGKKPWERFSAESWSSNPASLSTWLFTAIKLLKQVHQHTEFCSFSPAWCCQKLFQLLTGYRATLGSQTGRFSVIAVGWDSQEWCQIRRIAHLAGFKPIPSPCNTERGSGEICSGSPCEISRFKSFVSSFLTHFLSLMAHFWEDVAGVSPPGRDCC